MFPPTVWSISAPTSPTMRRKFACRIRRVTEGRCPDHSGNAGPGVHQDWSRHRGALRPQASARQLPQRVPRGLERTRTASSAQDDGLVSAAHDRCSPAPAKHRLGAVVRGTFSHDMLNVHFYGVFRKVEPDGNQLVGKAELQRLEHMLFAWRKVGQRFLRQHPAWRRCHRGLRGAPARRSRRDTAHILSCTIGRAGRPRRQEPGAIRRWRLRPESMSGKIHGTPRCIAAIGPSSSRFDNSATNAFGQNSARNARSSSIEGSVISLSPIFSAIRRISLS